MDLSAPTNDATTEVATEIVDEAAEATTQAAAATNFCADNVRAQPSSTTRSHLARTQSC
jgi:hypothetical protein